MNQVSCSRWWMVIFYRLWVTHRTQNCSLYSSFVARLIFACSVFSYSLSFPCSISQRQPLCCVRFLEIWTFESWTYRKWYQVVDESCRSGRFSEHGMTVDRNLERGQCIEGLVVDQIVVAFQVGDLEKHFFCNFTKGTWAKIRDFTRVLLSRSWDLHG